MKETHQNLYEGMYVLSARLSDDARKKAFEKLEAGIARNNGEILKIHTWGRRRLAYEIEGQREGYYYIVYFKVSPDAINELWQEYHLNEDLIRFVTLRADEVKETIEFKSLVEQQ
jgi:small subunit ribosomal protein S6